MKKTKLINSDLSYAISTMGHTDKLVIADSGLPIPKEEWRIDLALKKNTPSFIETLKITLSELKVERMVLASEIKENNPTVFEKIQKEADALDIKIEFISHENFKKNCVGSTAIVRTGEFSPYANIILYSGVVF